MEDEEGVIDQKIGEFEIPVLRGIMNLPHTYPLLQLQRTVHISRDPPLPQPSNL